MIIIPLSLGFTIVLSQISPLCSVPQVSHLERDLRSVAAEEGGREEVTMRSLARILVWWDMVQWWFKDTLW